MSGTEREGIRSLAGRCGTTGGAYLLGCVLGLLAPEFAWPAEWSVQPAISTAVGHDSNPLLLIGAHESSNVAELTPSMRIEGKTERSGIDIGLLLNYENYSSDQVENADRQILTFNSFSQTSERNKLGLNGEFRRDDLRQTVNGLTTSGGDSDVGLVQSNVTRDWRSLRPSWTRNLSERSSVQLSYGYTDVGFDKAAGTGLVDYTDQNLALTYSRYINPRDSLNVTMNSSRYRASAIDNSADTNRLLFGFAREFSESSRGSVAVGASKTRENVAGTVDDSSGYVVEANARETSETMELDGTLNHDVSPSGIGRSIQSDQLRLRMVRNLTSRLGFSLRATLLRNKALEGSDPTVDRHYYEIEPSIEYQWAPQWFFRAAYAYRYQKFDVDSESATSNAVYIGVAYNWRRQFFGR